MEQSDLERAAEYVDATELSDGRWAYFAEETNSWWVLEANELEDLCDYLDDEDPEISNDAYSHWCSGGYGKEMPQGWEPEEYMTFSGKNRPMIGESLT